MRFNLRRSHSYGLALIAVAALAAVASLATVASAGQKASPITLQVWRSSSEDLPVLKLLTQRFQKLHPDIRVNIQALDFNTYNTRVKLALSGRTPPDIVDGNYGYYLDATLVKGKLILPLTKYARKYQWSKRYSPTFLKSWSLTADGRFGKGLLYGASATGAEVGWYYNRSKLAELGVGVPRSIAEFESVLAAAKASGEVPIMVGNSDQWPGDHLFSKVFMEYLTRVQAQGIAYGAESAKWTSPAFVSAGNVLKRWVDKGYLVEGFNGVSYDDASARFSKGEGVFLSGGTWLTPGLKKAMGARGVGFFGPPPLRPGGRSLTQGSPAVPFHIAARSKHPDEAAMWLDYITNSASAKFYARTGAVPVANFNSNSLNLKKGTIDYDVFASWATLARSDGLMPYVSWSSGTIATPWFGGIQAFLAGQKPIEKVLEDTQADRVKFFTDNGYWK